MRTAISHRWTMPWIRAEAALEPQSQWKIQVRKWEAAVRKKVCLNGGRRKRKELAQDRML